MAIDEATHNMSEQLENNRLLRQARQLIEARQYKEAHDLLLGIDDPRADELLMDLRTYQAGASTDSAPSYTGRLLLSILLLLAFIIPGLVAFVIFGRQARQHPGAPGAQALIWLNRVVHLAVAGALALLGASALIALIISWLE